MMKPKTQSMLAITLMLMTCAAAAVAWSSTRRSSVVVLAAVGAFSLVWWSIRRYHLRADRDWLNSNSRREILFAIILASTILLGSISTTIFKNLEMINQDMSERTTGLLIGLMLVCMGNYMPKQGAKSCGCGIGCMNADEHSRGSTKMQRFMGWTFVIAGILYASIWLLVDLEKTSAATLLTFPAAILLIVLARVVYLRATRNQRLSAASIGERS